MRLERLSLLSAYGLGFSLVALGVWRLSMAGVPSVQLLLVVWEVVMGVLAIGGFMAVIRRQLTPRAFWELLFSASLFLGIWFFPLLVVPFNAGVLIALVLMLLPFLFPYVLFWNLFYVIGSVGVSFYFAHLLSPVGLLILSIGLTLHDLFVFGAKGFFAHWAPMLLARRLMPGFALMRDSKDLLRPVIDLIHQPLEYVSASELLLPLAMLVRALANGWTNGLWIFGGALIGVAISVGANVADRGPTTFARTGIPWIIIGVAIPFLGLWIFGQVV